MRPASRYRPSVKEVCPLENERKLRKIDDVFQFRYNMNVVQESFLKGAVCDTGLNASQLQPSKRIKRLRDRRDWLAKHHKKDIYCDNAEFLIRITSYNVCYTKLLRVFKQTDWTSQFQNVAAGIGDQVVFFTPIVFAERSLGLFGESKGPGGVWRFFALEHRNNFV